MGAAPLAGVDWQAIKSAVESGMDFNEISRTSGVGYWAIQKKAKREGWLTKMKMQEIVAKVTNPQDGMSNNVQRTAKAAQFWQSSLQRRQEAHKRQLALVTAKMWKKTIAAPPSVETVTDLEKLQKVTRLNLDMNTGESSPSITMLFGAQDDLASLPVIDASEGPASALEWEEGEEASED